MINYLIMINYIILLFILLLFINQLIYDQIIFDKQSNSSRMGKYFQELVLAHQVNCQVIVGPIQKVSDFIV